MERERGGGDDEVEHEVDGEEVREEARREDVAEDLGQIEHGRVWHDRESERPEAEDDAISAARQARRREGAGDLSGTKCVTKKERLLIKILSFSFLFH